MIRDITLGQYYDADSIIHRLDPRVKLAFTLIYIASLYVGKSVYCYLFAAAFLCGLIALSRVPVHFMLRGLKSIVVILVISALFNIFVIDGQVLVRFWIFRITLEGLKTAGLMVVRLILLIVGSSVMTLTTTPNDLTDGLERSLGFLKVIHVPIHEISMMMSIALRFIPILVEEVNKIMKAQMARGADFDGGGLIKKAKAMVPMLIPLFVSSFRRAADLALAMEARCYHGGEGRTKMYPLKYKKEDFLAYLVLFVYLGCMIALGRLT
ncbi:MAG: energy-coupling factor transporter transmembrane protein EcfT [Lachnospiraceae bacterium]|nr:energy-coupling factor transporter transmembrane protein EcfT [Lachnospiraceae bacterium]